MFPWTFASDFLRSKTTHLAFATVIGAITAVATHHASWLPATATAIFTVAIACLRDCHAGYAQHLADLLSEINETLSWKDTDGDATAPTVVAAPATAPALPPFIAAELARIKAYLALAAPANPMAAAESGAAMPSAPVAGGSE